MIDEAEPEPALHAEVTPVDDVVPVALDVHYPVSPYAHNYPAADAAVGADGFNFAGWRLIVFDGEGAGGASDDAFSA